MIQKSVLLGSREGSWIPCFGITKLKLRVSAKGTTRLKAELKERGPVKEIIMNCAEKHIQSIPDCQFIRVTMLDGEHEDLLVTLIGEEKRAIQTA